MQKHSFYPPKGHLLPTKSIGFVDQKLTFREVKYYVLQWPYYQKVTILHFFRRHKTAFCVGVNTFQHNSALRVFSYSVFSFIGAAFHLRLQNYGLQFSQQQSDVVQMTDDSFLSSTYNMMKVISFSTFGLLVGMFYRILAIQINQKVNIIINNNYDNIYYI